MSNVYGIKPVEARVVSVPADFPPAHLRMGDDDNYTFETLENFDQRLAACIRYGHEEQEEASVGTLRVRLLDNKALELDFEVL